ncbi:hypothetical protein ACHAXA_009582, partial [Cyclostephanos tholiformis]
YVCDCSQAHLGPAGLSMTGVSDVRYAGVYCEFRATAYCQKGGGGYSDHAFCANGGECRLMVRCNEEHAGCKCPPYYEGHFCQFLRGRFSRNDREIDTSDSATENPGGMISPQNAEFIGGKSVYNKRTTSGGFSLSGPFVATSDALDADGGVLMEAMDEVDLNDDASVKGKFA